MAEFNEYKSVDEIRAKSELSESFKCNPTI